jgi:hypothetical protein
VVTIHFTNLSVLNLAHVRIPGKQLNHSEQPLYFSPFQISIVATNRIPEYVTMHGDHDGSGAQRQTGHGVHQWTCGGTFPYVQGPSNGACGDRVGIAPGAILLARVNAASTICFPAVISKLVYEDRRVS